MIRQEVSCLRYEFKTPQEMNCFLAFVDALLMLELLPHCSSFIYPYELTVTYNEKIVDV